MQKLANLKETGPIMPDDKTQSQPTEESGGGIANLESALRAAPVPRTSNLLQLVYGFLIGVANVIPGVSGGTFALVLGIFDRLVDALKAIDITFALSALRLLTFSTDSRSKFADQWRRIDGTFLTLLAVGAGSAIISCAWLLDYLLVEHPGATLAFFIGLIIPSLIVPYRMMTKRGPAQLFWVLPGIALTVWVSISDISTGDAENLNPVIIALGGMLAISAMILPGISGSFCLLVLGLYQPTIRAIKSLPSIDAIQFLATMSVGIGLGFVTFTRLMSFLLRRFRSATLAFLIGLILGSFWVLWPVKDFTSSNPEMKRNVQIATAPNRLPGTREGDLLLCGQLALASIGGLIAALGVNRLGSNSH